MDQWIAHQLDQLAIKLDIAIFQLDNDLAAKFGGQVAHTAVVYAMPNGLAWFDGFLGLLKAGAVIVPVDGSEPPEAQRQLARVLRAGFLWTGDRLEPLAKELNGILAWIEQMDEVDIDGVEPMTSNVAQPMRLRDDVVTDGGKVEAVLSNAPRSADGFFVVPKVVE